MNSYAIRQCAEHAIRTPLYCEIIIKVRRLDVHYIRNKRLMLVAKREGNTMTLWLYDDCVHTEELEPDAELWRAMFDYIFTKPNNLKHIAHKYNNYGKRAGGVARHYQTLTKLCRTSQWNVDDKIEAVEQVAQYRAGTLIIKCIDGTTRRVKVNLDEAIASNDYNALPNAVAEWEKRNAVFRIDTRGVKTRKRYLPIRTERSEMTDWKHNY